VVFGIEENEPQGFMREKAHFGAEVRGSKAIATSKRIESISEIV
jgi:hypothetical protein